MQLKAKDIAFRYGKGKWILKEFNMSLKSGEIVGLTGSSGCGKTTLARILSGYEKPDKGSITLDEEIVKVKEYHPVQMVFQHPEKAVNPRWKIKKTLNEGWQVDKELLFNLGIREEWLERWPNELSGGELQRFCVARAIGPKTKFLIADEMTTMLDAVTQAQIWSVVLDIAKKRNIGILLVSHEQSLMKCICDRIINIEN